ncbi:MAG TPA: SpoIID/LytB domain-containing protein [Blastocatellia bacterium]|nr:SpoIID/LytB domain-containing protein [Blastocatellia bacterium]
MNILNRSRRLRLRLVFALAIIVSGRGQMVALVEPDDVGSAVPPQATSRSENTASQKNQQLDERLTRPRRTETQNGAVKYTSPEGPIIRVALMTDVSSIALSSSSGLQVRRAVNGFDQARASPNETLTIQLRQRPDPVVTLETDVAVYRVCVGSSRESLGARKLADELKRNFFEQVTLTFDEKEKEYSVLIGQFKNRSEAGRFLERLQKTGYQSLRIVTESRATDAKFSEALTDTNARAAKYKANPIYARAAGSVERAERTAVELIALSAHRVAASSEDELVVSPSDSSARFEQSRQSAGLAANQGAKPLSGRDRSEPVENQYGIPLAPPTVRIGNKEYRGDVHLVLNQRGRINVINALPLEQYLRGVVPLELSPGSFPEIEALKAQAVAARSYALAHLGQHRNEGFDLVDDTRAQVYGGLSAEREMTNRAIDETRGIAVVFPNGDGLLTPIEGLYTANCGGRTENNDEVFGGKPVPYLRAVVCAPDGQPLAGRDIVSSRSREPLFGIDGHSISREVALLEVIGFSLPRRVTTTYLSRSPEAVEIKGWIEQASRLAQRSTPSVPPGNGARLAEFAHLVTTSVYGEGRANTLMAPADIDYVLAGLRVQQMPREARADVALLLKEGIMRLSAESALDGRAPITRAQAIETLARAISVVLQPANPASQTPDSRSQRSSFRIPAFKSEIALPSENGRLIVAATREASAREKNSRYTSVNTSGPGRLAGTPQSVTAKNASTDAGEKGSATANITARTQSSQSTWLEISEGAWLFRDFGGESHQVERLSLIGGERIVYHLNARGQVDFLEASISDRSASSDRYSSVAQWQERIPVEDLRQRLSRIRISVGRLENIEPVAFSSSNRVTELEVTGDQGSARLRRPQIRAALGLKEYLFVVDREIDARGQLVAFVFTGRGWGHGVGMCQTGAYGLAKEGYSYTSILQKYYTGVTLTKMY